jgi:hypothetical protein
MRTARKSGTAVYDSLRLATSLHVCYEDAISRKLQRGSQLRSPLQPRTPGVIYVRHDEMADRVRGERGGRWGTRKRQDLAGCCRLRNVREEAIL